MLSTEINDVCKMLNFVFSDRLMTHQIPLAMEKIKEINPKWFADGVYVINEIKRINKTNDFEKLMEIIDSKYSSFEIELGNINSEIHFLVGFI
jgi:hypothetical protein